MKTVGTNGTWLGRPEEVYLLLLWFPTHYSVLVSGPPGVGKFEYLLMQARDALSVGERVVFVTLDLHPDEIRLRAKALGLDLAEHEGETFAFVDCYSPAAQSQPDAVPGRRTFLVSSYSNLEGIDMAIHKAAQTLGTPVRIFVYTISTLFLHNSGQAIGKFLQIVTARVKSNLGFIEYAVHEGVHDGITMNLLRSLTDGVIEMRFDERMSKEVRMHHMRGYRILPIWHKIDRLSALLEAFQ